MHIIPKVVLFFCAVGMLSQDCFGSYTGSGDCRNEESFSRSSSASSSYESWQKCKPYKRNGAAIGGVAGIALALLVADKLVKKLGITDSVSCDKNNQQSIADLTKIQDIVQQAQQELNSLFFQAGQAVPDDVQIKIIQNLPKKSTSLRQWLGEHKIVLSKITIATACTLFGMVVGLYAGKTMHVNTYKLPCMRSMESGGEEYRR